MVIILNPNYPKSEEYNKKALEYNENILEELMHLSEPLINLGVTVFEYTHFFKNSSCLYLSTNKEWHIHYVKNYANSIFIKTHINEVFKNKTQYYSWDTSRDLPKEKEISQFISSRRKFGLWHDFTKYIHYNTSIEAWSFSMPKDDNKLINFFLNNQHRLAQFIISFRSKSSKLIDVPTSEKTMDTGENLFVTCSMHISDFEKKMQEFEQITKIDKFPLDTTNGIVLLSDKELRVLCCLSNGHQLKAIEWITGISHNTVASCWENIKRKTQCTDKVKIIRMYKDSMLESVCRDSTRLENVK